MSRLDLLENCFSELINFSSSDDTAPTLLYDQLTHRFRPQREFTQIKERDFISELKFALEDITNFPKITFKLLHHLIGDLNIQETIRINAKLARTTVSIKNAHDHILDYTIKNEIPEVFKQEMSYHIEQLKNLMREAQILEVETSVEKSEGFSDDLPGNLQSRVQLTPKNAEMILKKITSEVDQMIRRMPFIVPDEERSRLIGERFRSQLEKLE